MSGLRRSRGRRTWTQGAGAGIDMAGVASTRFKERYCYESERI